MTDRNKFEQMLEALINEETEKAKEIFHDIVVEKSRDIYESLLEDDFAEEEEMPAEEPVEEMFGDEEGEEEGEEEEGEEEEGGFGDEEGGESDEEMDDSEQTDRILDLEDALEELKAEFEQLMAGDMGGDDMGGDMGGDATDDMMGAVSMDDEPMDEFAFEGDEEEEESQLNEYVNQVGGKQYNQFGKMGDNGQNTKSVVAGKNDMGGTTANIAKSFSTEKGGTQGGLLNPSTKEENFGNINVPGGNAGKTGFKKKEPGHGAEKKGSAEKADNTNSMINGAPKRAK